MSHVATVVPDVIAVGGLAVPVVDPPGTDHVFHETEPAWNTALGVTLPWCPHAPNMPLSAGPPKMVPSVNA